MQELNLPLARVLGWDLLRGLCALAVCTYHLFYWMDIAALHTYGMYGVYLFFVLSGASLAYTYGEKISSASFSFKDFLLTRYSRLMPLFAALLVLELPWKLSQEPQTMEFLGKLLLNLLLMFGFYQPAAQSMLVGGWSLGIEAVFYLLFPMMMWSLRIPYLGWSVWLGLLVLQAVWIMATVGSDSGYDANQLAYHHVPAFAAYFFGGCLIGNARRLQGRRARLETWRGFVAIFCGFALMMALNAGDPTRVLTGWRGIVLTALCFLLVTGAGRLEVNDLRVSAVAVRLGNATYGLYLMHPVLFFGLTWVVLPKLGFTLEPQHWTLAWRMAMTALVMSGAFLLALASEHYFEQPVRRRVRGFLAQRRLSENT
jgi:peptidoglycan/LPS O-acetylase OafA/YrhL